MFRNRKFIQYTAVFLTLHTLYFTFLPTLSYALTSGPTAPEASSFEPVDTTDMVNLSTGDFTYNVPLMEVPGPAGGYPITLAYHAGIQPNQDASWVGLGWSLNPGAINRIVNGYADDHNNVRDVDRVFWEGGEEKTYTIGLSVGIAKGASVMAGVTFSNDTYRGIGKGSFVGIEAKKGSIGVSGYYGNKPYGGSYYGFSTGPTVSGSDNDLNYSGSLGIGYNSGSGWNVNSSGNLGAVGASISSSNMKPGLSVGGAQARAHNSKAGNISTKSFSFAFDVPLFYGLNLRLGYDYLRYWIDETAEVFTNGSLYYPSSTITSTYFDDHAYDTYDILDQNIDIVDHSDPEKALGGSFPDYDQYTVLAQGLSGNIRPYHFQKSLTRQNKKDNNTFIIKHYPLTQVDKPVEFRFINDFSNRFEYTPSNFEGTETKPLAFEFDDSMVTGETGADGFRNNQLAGSKHVKWFTNRQIINGEAKNKGFINNRASGFIRDNNLQIGGFMITSESGVTYHFSLPAYSFDEYMKSENTEDYKVTEGDMYNELSKPEKYAYTWFLTAVTGPDFLDRNNNGLVDDGDFGYWVGFEYGKWTDNYRWRNPGEGYHKDIDRKFRNFSSGKKELYYLDAIHTASHIALFVKKLRNDGKGVSSINGGYDPIRNKAETVETFPVSVLALKEIYLFKKENFDFEDLSQKRTVGKSYNESFDNCMCCSPNDQLCIFPDRKFGNCEEQEGCDSRSKTIQINIESLMGQNIIDETDFSEGEVFRNVLRGISFEADYSLCQGTPNSYHSYSYGSSPFTPSLYKSGKLTLKALHFLGKGGASIMPPTKFTYDKNPAYNKDAYDMWGFYKSDYVDNGNENLARLTSGESALNVDAWSLSMIETSLGAKIKIKYESDEYLKPTLYKNNILTIKEIIPSESPGKVKILFHEKNIQLSEAYLSMSNIEVLFRRPIRWKENRVIICDGLKMWIRSNGIFGNFYELQKYTSNQFQAIEVGGDFVEIESFELYDKLLEILPGYYTDTKCYDALSTNLINPPIDILEPIVVAGNVLFDGNIVIPGGGLRAKEIVMENPITAYTSSTIYEHQHGTTSYEPIGLEKVIFNFNSLESSWSAEISRIEKARADYKKSIYKNFSKLLAISREIPGPGVMYEYVTVKEKRNNIELPNYTTYHFEVYKEGLVDIDEADGVNSTLENANYDGTHYRAKNTRKVALKNYASRIGNLKSITLYNSNGTKVSETINEYLNDGLDDSFEQNKTVYENRLKERFNNQGVTEETFSNARFVRYKQNFPLPYNDYAPGGDEYHLLGIISRKETFPSILTGQTNINYKTGVTTSSKNLAFDFYSGAVTKTLSTDSYGNRYLSESQPAYRQYPAMGLKVDNPGNKHMLVQTAATYLYKVSNETDLTPTGLLTASIQTWSNTTSILGHESQPGIWRKEAGYTWDGQETLNIDGTYKMSDFNLYPFNWADPASNIHWQKLNQITLYDRYSHVLEAVDINGKYGANRMDYKQEKVIASATNASYHEIAFSGAEHSIKAVEEGGVLKGDGDPVFNRGHTGDYALSVGSGRTGFNYTISGGKSDLSKKYRASVWVYLPGEAETAAEIENVELFYTIDGQEIKGVHPQLHKNKAKSWYLLNLDINPSSGGDIVISCRNNTSREVYFDDFRVHPLDAVMNTYIYDQKTNELIYILDPHNIYTHYEYDAAGRVIKVSRERLNFDFGEEKESYKADQVLKEVRYNYGKN